MVRVVLLVLLLRVLRVKTADFVPIVSVLAIWVFKLLLAIISISIISLLTTTPVVHTRIPLINNAPVVIDTAACWLVASHATITASDLYKMLGIAFVMAAMLNVVGIAGGMYHGLVMTNDSTADTLDFCSLSYAVILQ